MLPGVVPCVAQLQVDAGGGIARHRRRHAVLEPFHCIHLRRFPFVPDVLVAQSCSEILDDACLTLNAPSVKASRPAVQEQGQYLLMARLPVPPVYLAVGPLYPAVVLVLPFHVLVCLGDIHWKMAHAGWDSMHEVAVGEEVVVVLIKRRILELRRRVDETRIRAMRIGMQGDAVALLRLHQPQDVLEVPYPIALWVAGVGRLGIPGGHRTDEHLVIFVVRHAVDGVLTQAIAAGVHLWSDNLARLHQHRWVSTAVISHAGAFHGIVHFVSNDPDVAAAGVSNPVGAALGEEFILVRAWNGAGGLVAVIETGHDAEPLVSLGRVVEPRAPAGIKAKGVNEKNPALLSFLCHDMFTARIMDAKDVLGFVPYHFIPSLERSLNIDASGAYLSRTHYTAKPQSCPPTDVEVWGRLRTLSCAQRIRLLARGKKVGIMLNACRRLERCARCGRREDGKRIRPL